MLKSTKTPITFIDDDDHDLICSHFKKKFFQSCFNFR